MSEFTKIKMFSDSDLDGVSCGVIANVLFGENVDITFSIPKYIDELIINFILYDEYRKYDKIFITDLAIKESTAKLINETKLLGKFILLDHHRSNYPNKIYDWAIIDEYRDNRKTCGTELFWTYFKENYPDFYNENTDNIDLYVEYVRLWDTWDWTDSDSGNYVKKLSTLFSLYSNTKYLNTMTIKLIQDDEFISDEENNIINIEETRKKRYINQKLKNVRIINVNNYIIGYCFAEEYVSELGNTILKKIDGITFAAIINADLGVVSLRALEESNVDLSVIAREFSTQGGGHPLSAGFTFDIELTNDLINKIFKIN